MDPGAVSCRESVVTHDGMVSVIIIRIQYNNLWGIISSGKSNKIFFIDNRNVRWKLMRFIAGYSF